jgi:hypothetical protein
MGNRRKVFSLYKFCRLTEMSDRCEAEKELSLNTKPFVTTNESLCRQDLAVPVNNATVDSQSASFHFQTKLS